MQDVLRLLERVRLSLHVETAQGDFTLRRVVDVVLFRTHIKEHLLWPFVCETSWMTSEIAWHLRVQVLQMPSIDTLSFLWVRSTVLQFWIVNAPAAVTHNLELLAWLKVWVYWLLRLIVPIRITELLIGERAQSLHELTLDAHFRFPYIVK